MKKLQQTTLRTLQVVMILLTTTLSTLAQSLTVGNNNNGSTNKLYLSGTDLTHYIYSTGTFGNNTYFGEWNGDFHFINTATYSEVFTLTNGNVGINITAPAAKLDVNGIIKATGYKLPTTVPANTQYIIKADDSGNFVWTPFRDIFNIYGHTWGANVNSAGYKLVGSSSSTAGITIDKTGKLVADSAIVAYTFSSSPRTIPDYVFEKEYPLQSLSEVSDYIKQHKHLPEIPSNEEYKKRGNIDLTELSLLLLKKVEELTLYSIEMDKWKEGADKKIQEMETKNKSLVEYINNSKTKN